MKETEPLMRCRKEFLLGKTKSFEIPKKMVMEAYRQVKKNKGATGFNIQRY